MDRHAITECADASRTCNVHLKRGILLKRKTITFLLIFTVLATMLSSAALASDEMQVSKDSAQADCQRAEHGFFGVRDPAKLTAILTEEKIISQQTADKLLAYLQKTEQNRKAESEKIKSMTEEQRKSYFRKKREASFQNEPGAELVENGILTQKELDAVRTYFEKQMEEKFGQRLETVLSALVSKGTLTASQKSAVEAYVKERMTQRSLEMKKTRDMSDTERRAYFKDKKEQRTRESGFFNELVESKILTKAQADEIGKALMPEQQKK